MSFDNKQPTYEMNEYKPDNLEMEPGTARDEQDMQRLGRSQQLSRNFHALSIFGLTSVVMFTWEAILAYVGSVTARSVGCAYELIV